MENGQKNVFELFSGDKHFKVPKYQRAYAWELKQRKDFLEDIKNQRKDKDYFFGTILFQDNGIKEGFEQIDIVDGQQRITTIVVFMKVLLDILKKKDKEKDYSREFRRYIKDKDSFKLELIQIDDEFFKSYIIGDNKLEEEYIKTPSQKRLCLAKKDFEAELSKLSFNELKEYKEKLENAKLLTYSVNDAAEATLIFETTNDRGKSLTNLEKIKSFLMHKIYLTKEKPTEILNSIHDRFGEIYRILEEINYKVDEDSVLQYHFITYFKWRYTLKKKDYVNYVIKIKEKINDMIRTNPKKVPKFIDDYTRDLKESFHIIKLVLWDRNKYLRDLFILERIYLFYPLIIKCFKYNGSDDKKDYYEVIKLLEIFSFRVYGVGRKPSFTARDWFYTLARDFKGDFSNLKCMIVEKIMEYVRNNHFTEKLSSPYLYQELPSIDRKYLFWKYENFLRTTEQPIVAKMSEEEFLSKDPRFKLTIEHIASQHPKVSTEGLDLPKIDEDFEEKYLHSIGNLTFDPNSANASKSNKPIEIKKSKYFIRAPFKTQNELDDFLDSDKWTEKSIVIRGKKILKFALNQWNPYNIVNQDMCERMICKEEPEEEVFELKKEHKGIMEEVQKQLNSKFGKWTKSFDAKPEGNFELYQSRDGYVTNNYIKWDFEGTKFCLECGIWRDENEEFKFYIEIKSERKSESISYKMYEAEIQELFEKNDYSNESSIEEKPVFVKSIILSEIKKQNIIELAIDEVERAKPIIEKILNN